MAVVEMPLTHFRWRKKQRRLVVTDRRLAGLQGFRVKGTYFTLLFKRQGEMVDPHTATNKAAVLFTPCPFSSPKEYHDLKMYIHTR